MPNANIAADDHPPPHDVVIFSGPNRSEKVEELAAHAH